MQPLAVPRAVAVEAGAGVKRDEIEVRAQVDLGAHAGWVEARVLARDVVPLLESGHDGKPSFPAPEAGVGRGGQEENGGGRKHFRGYSVGEAAPH